MDQARYSGSEARADDCASSGKVYYVQEHRRAEIMTGVVIESDQEGSSDEEEPIDAWARLFVGFRGGLEELKVKNMIDLHRLSLQRRAQPHIIRSSAIDLPDVEITC